jgi:hypothetical protein
MNYEEEYKVMDRALKAEGTVRIGFQERPQARHFRFRLNKARQLDRDYNGKRYATDHPMHQQSEYDALVFRLREDREMYWVYADRSGKSTEVGIIEEVPKGKNHEPIRQLITVRRF